MNDSAAANRTPLDTAHTAATLRVLHDPAGYAHASWLAALHIDARWPPRHANRLLLRTPSLRDTALPFARWSEPAVRFCVAEWAVLPAVLYLCGARRLRRELVAQRRLPQLAWRATAFLASPVALSAEPLLDIALPDAALYAVGLGVLDSALPTLPDALLARLRLALPFDATSTSVAEAAAALPALARAHAHLLMSCAIAHARNT